jgi:hypothetical protein
VSSSKQSSSSRRPRSSRKLHSSCMHAPASRGYPCCLPRVSRAFPVQVVAQSRLRARLPARRTPPRSGGLLSSALHSSVPPTRAASVTRPAPVTQAGAVEGVSSG